MKRDLAVNSKKKKKTTFAYFAGVLRIADSKQEHFIELPLGVTNI